MHTFSTAIVGGGASGIAAAVSAARKGSSVVICEKMPRLGKKILASGNGRCNLLNETLDETCYNPGSRGLVKSVLSVCGLDRLKDFFRGLGLEMYSENGRIFPVTNQSSTVSKVLEMELERLSVAVEPGFDVVDISDRRGGFLVASRKDKKICCDSVVVAGGGMAYPALGSDGSCYRLAERFGHHIVEPVPSAVPILVKDALCQALQGQKIAVRAKGIVNGTATCEASGDLLFTRYGLSGTAILDVSDDISVALNRHRVREAAVSIDMVPFLTYEALKGHLNKRLTQRVAPDELLTGILPNKFGAALKGLLSRKNVEEIAHRVKDMRFKALGTRGWNEAEFTNGGITAREVNESTLESRLKKGLYFAGEVLDVHGKRGGYNLAWAWASGIVAGRAG